MKVYKRRSFTILITQKSFTFTCKLLPIGKKYLFQVFQTNSWLLQMGKRRGGPPLRKEIDNIQYLQSHPEIHQYFSDAGCLTYVERLQEGYHQGIT
jgi:hypothetical protein